MPKNLELDGVFILIVCLVFVMSYFDFLHRIASKILCFEDLLTFVTFSDRHKLLIWPTKQ